MIENSRTPVILMTVVFLSFLLTGAALPVMPLHLKNALSQDVFIIGIIAGLQFFSALISRIWAGSYADNRGPKSAMIVGLGLTVGTGAVYLFSLAFLNSPAISVVVLALGRVLMGSAECFVLVGAVSWSLQLAGAARTGKAIAQMGNAMYVGLALGAPLGSLSFEGFGFQFIGIVTLLLPLLALFVILQLPSAAGGRQKGGRIMVVLKSVWVPGLGLSFASLGYGAMMAFSVLLFVEQGWQPAWLSFTVFAISFISARIVFGDFADRFGGARIAQIFAIVQVAGLALIAVSPSALLGYLGAALTGAGYSLVYPALALEAVNRAPPTSKGLAIGTYTAFLEFALAIASPLLGLLASQASLSAVFMASAAAAIGTVWVCGYLRRLSVPIENIE